VDASEDDELALPTEEVADELAEDQLGSTPQNERASRWSLGKINSSTTPKDSIANRTSPRARRKSAQSKQVSETAREEANNEDDAMKIGGDVASLTASAIGIHAPIDDAMSSTLSSPAKSPSNQLSTLKSIALSKLSQRRPIPLRNLDAEYAKVYQLLHATITAGESNSLLLIGARGSGKTAMVNAALRDLSRSQKEHFHTIRLNGFIQTDDKLALREIWRQLGREMEIEDAEDTGGKSYANTLAMLLALLSHPDEIAGTATDGSRVAKSVIFIMDEFDLFATHARQTLLYNLLDIAQSRKAPIAVIGLTARIDVTEALEKRVKSRFSHRYVHLSLPKTLSEFVDVGSAALRVEAEELTFEEKAILVGGEAGARSTASRKNAKNKTSCNALVDWNNAVDVSILFFLILTSQQPALGAPL
jgi:origin recognition complex subunit 4